MKRTDQDHQLLSPRNSKEFAIIRLDHSTSVMVVNCAPPAEVR